MNIQPIQIPQVPVSTHAPRILIQVGSLRKKSYSWKLAQQVKDLLEQFGAEVKIFDPSSLPIYNQDDQDLPAVQEYLLDYIDWAEGFFWIAPELHGSMPAVMKNQMDWIPLKMGAKRDLTQGKTLSLMQITGGSQSFNVVNDMRRLGRWMRLLTLPNQSSVAKAWKEIDENDGTLSEDSPFFNRIVDVCEELVRFTLLTRDQKNFLIDRYSERVESDEALIARVNLNKAA